jgi:uncharacterized protein YoxC
MSQAQQRHGDHAASLFPFLAVLLCTVGALILMLVIIVDQSQASVKQAIDDRAEKAERLRAQVEVIRESFREDREKIQLEIEKKRMALQSLEQQTKELSEELDQLAKTSELIDKDLQSDDSEEQVESALTDLQKQLQDAAERLKNKLDNPPKSKPVFAIIPYEGGNGTHRRPIYLECRADGIMVQPEGVFIGLKDLRPPYGPGNPLDAALRSARSYYAPDGAALNTSAYPLLVVRSSGIRTYALARLAMAGWDDQFGYELIEDDMELAYPKSESRLAKELERTLTTARDRQAALVMAMPGKYRQAMDELSEDHLDMGDEPGQWTESAGGGSGGGGFGAGEGSGSGFGTGDEAGSGRLASGASGSTFGQGRGGIAGGRGGFAFAPDGASGGNGPGNMGPDGSAPGGMNGSGNVPGARGAGGTYGFATGGNAVAAEGGQAFGAPGGNSGGYFGGPAGNGNASSAQDGQVGSFAEGAFSGNQYTQAGSGSANGAMGQGGPGGQGAAGEGGGQQSAKGFASSSGSGNSNNSGGRPGNFRDAMNAARSKKDGSENAQTTVAGSASETGTGGSSMVAANSDGFGSMGPNGIEMDPNGGGTPTLDMNMRKGNKQQNADAVAKRRGRNWAWTAGPSRQTAVVRHIRIQCYEDRWVVLPDAGTKDKPQTVMLDVSLQTSAEQLAKIVTDRVDRWGYALSQGYWKPILQVEVAPRSEYRYTQLQRLLDGSGLEVQRVQPNASSK